MFSITFIYYMVKCTFTDDMHHVHSCKCINPTTLPPITSYWVSHSSG